MQLYIGATEKLNGIYLFYKDIPGPSGSTYQLFLAPTEKEAYERIAVALSLLDAHSAATARLMTQGKK